MSDPIIGVRASDLAKLIEEAARGGSREQELLDHISGLVEKNRALDLEDRVGEFMRVVTPEAYDARMLAPGVPAPSIARLRARLVAEEFFELMAALFAPIAYERTAPVEPPPWIRLDELRKGMDTFIAHADIRADLPEVADACGDIDYVVAGLRIAFGIDGRPVARLIHAANMAKAGGPIREDGKRLKPDGWTKADVAGALREQGWTPPIADRCAWCGRQEAATLASWSVMSDGSTVCSDICRVKLCGRRTDGRHLFTPASTAGDGICEECQRPRVMAK